ncbi:hypothetical protein TREMEDRAFT_32993 [Tremella mesenterica DSM 1558]|uniref:uncharacterized protein n=1 Tax=Tremella mesenterica (strain ATCC 24925 / CBS 8224 / DSM 1558 / NBRC 9311 / NRRL Y-6157 / RJB 2259-6 / UBC 559-6) TaxID=578456 RepID=UPI0003F48D7B|nr:uncharacterized protein TREMEDRAFT_32993 [Tremella mesenterica DSM 1558]EIW67849.1 hypothetical protein TREMEDRAFT_32993 [Tremella mesenterica DSM 1558]
MFNRIVIFSRKNLPSPIRSITSRTISTSLITLTSRSFSRPGPPPLPPADQAEFDRLLKINSSIETSSVSDGKNELEEHRDLRRGPKPDFQGEENPKTGERGGPKVDPFKSGDNDWSYAGRVTVGF